MSKPISGKNKKTIISLSSAEYAQREIRLEYLLSEKYLFA